MRHSLPRHLDPTVERLVAGTRVTLPKSAARTGTSAIWFAPGARTLSKDLDQNDWVYHVLKTNPDCQYSPEPKPRKARTKDSEGNNVRARDARHAARGNDLNRAVAEMTAKLKHVGFVRRGGESLPRPGEERGAVLAFIDEKGDRSKHPDGAIMRRFVQLLPRRPKAGLVKEYIRPMDKRLACYMRYIRMNPKVFGVIRIDADHSFSSLEHLWETLSEMVSNGEIPFTPHLSVSDELADGSIERPHLLIFLPVYDSVRMDGRTGPGARNLLRAVERAWVRALEAAVGADRGGVSNNQLVKNPLCPTMKTGILQQSEFMTLRDMHAFFRARDPKMLQSFDRDDRAAEKALAEAGLPNDQPSNNVLRWVHKVTWREATVEQRSGSERFGTWMADRARMRTDLADIVAAMPRPPSWVASDRQVMAVIRAVARRCSERFDPSMCAEPVNRGAMAPVFAAHDGSLSIYQKQVLSGPWSGERHAESTADKVVAAIRSAEEREGVRMSKPALMAELRAAQVAGRSTLFARWDEFRALADTESRAVAGKKGNNNRGDLRGSCAGAETAEKAEVGAEDPQFRAPVPTPEPANNDLPLSVELPVAVSKAGLRPSEGEGRVSVGRDTPARPHAAVTRPELDVLALPMVFDWEERGRSDDLLRRFGEMLERKGLAQGWTSQSA